MLLEIRVCPAQRLSSYTFYVGILIPSLVPLFGHSCLWPSYQCHVDLCCVLKKSGYYYVPVYKAVDYIFRFYLEMFQKYVLCSSF